METRNHETSTPMKNNATSHPRIMTGGGSGKWYLWLKIVKLRQGSGKDRQGMAVKAKGLKA